MRALGIERALGLQTQMMQIGGAVDDLGIKVATCDLQAARRGFDPV
jgi:hypothetical protein